MSVAYYIVLNREDPKFDPFVNGKLVAQRPEVLDRLARSLQVRPLSEFCSRNPEETEDFLEAEGVAPGSVEWPDEQWFEVAEGLASIHAIRSHLLDHPEACRDAEGVLRALDEYKRVLEKAASADCRWHMAIDF